MISRKQVEKKYPLVNLDRLDEVTQNKVAGAMIKDDWSKVDGILQPMEDEREGLYP